MATLTSLTQRALIAGGFALAMAAAPLVTAAISHPAGSLPAVASCPSGEVPDPVSGACKPATLNPLDPGKVPLATEGLTSSRDGDVGSLPEVDGIPCNSNHGGGGSTGACIGLSENQNTFKEPKTSISTSP